jgi:P-type E1-E2 ATPase
MRCSFGSNTFELNKDGYFASKEIREDTLRQMSEMNSRLWTITRAGGQMEAKGEDLLVGDIVHLEGASSVLPCDLVLLPEGQILIDESNLTGEPEPAQKSYNENATLYASTVIRGGKAKGFVCRVGKRSEFGKM